MRSLILALSALALSMGLDGCIVTSAVGLAADVVETAVEVPIKVGSAAVHAVSGSSDDDKKKQQQSQQQTADPNKNGTAPGQGG